jgi:hypothetical protein
VPPRSFTRPPKVWANSATPPLHTWRLCIPLFKAEYGSLRSRLLQLKTLSQSQTHEVTMRTSSSLLKWLTIWFFSPQVSILGTSASSDFKLTAETSFNKSYFPITLKL